MSLHVEFSKGFTLELAYVSLQYICWRKHYDSYSLQVYGEDISVTGHDGP
jgi:hypothetical protein